MLRLDVFLLDCVFQPATDWICDITGRDCFDQARGLWCLATLAAMVGTAICHPGIAEFGIVITAIIPLSMLNIARISMERKEHHLGFLNKRRGDGIPRLLLLAFMIFCDALIVLDPQSFYIISQSTFLVWAAYAEACTPRPPKPVRRLVPSMITRT